ncbi:MAG: MBL fold metallo-hydrolase [Clostridia bacterium]|jgi:competence protein ComEC|nr:MBL fold metallo-hydrolase [Clostridia bacterium]
MKHFTLTFGNVGYGEAMLFELSDPSSKRGVFSVLFDGGGADPETFHNPSAGQHPFIEHLKKLGIDHIDAVIISHIHEDHVSGLVPIVKAYPPKIVYQTLPPDFWRTEMKPLSAEAGETVSLQKFTRSLNDFREICEHTTKTGGKVVQVGLGETLSFPDGLTAFAVVPNREKVLILQSLLKELYRTADDKVPDQSLLQKLDGYMNNVSLGFRFDYGKAHLLLAGDTNRAGFEGVDTGELKADLYKVGHHGQIDGADESLLRAISPKVVVCCASCDRLYNSAHPDLLRLIHNQGAELWFSDCPPNVAGEPVPPHEFLRIHIDNAGGIKARYF